MACNFSQWLDDCSHVMGLEDVGHLMRDRTLIVHDIICTFVHPCGNHLDMAAVLLDAGMISTVTEHDLAGVALSRNLENFLRVRPCSSSIHRVNTSYWVRSSNLRRSTLEVRAIA